MLLRNYPKILMRITQIFIIENNYIKKVLLVFIFIFYISLLKDSNIFISSITNLKSSFVFFPFFPNLHFLFISFEPEKILIR
jgi:hypothetical protein